MTKSKYLRALGSQRSKLRESIRVHALLQLGKVDESLSIARHRISFKKAKLVWKLHAQPLEHFAKTESFHVDR